MQNIHENSFTALRELEATLDQRTQLILSVIKRSTGPLSARDILDRINYERNTDEQDMNFVRPRLTELKGDGLIVELTGKQIDRKSGRPCALFEYAGKGIQLSFAFQEPKCTCLKACGYTCEGQCGCRVCLKMHRDLQEATNERKGVTGCREKQQNEGA